MAFLEQRSLFVIERNYRCSVGEIDIVAQEADELVFVEVRSRMSSEHGDASDAVGVTKQQQIARVAQFYIDERKPKISTCRFDVVAITGGEIEWFRDAFRPGLP